MLVGAQFDTLLMGDSVPEKRSKISMPGLGTVDAVEVPVVESTERWTEVRLDDGSLIRLKPVVLSAFRIENQYDPEGNPLYTVKVNQILLVASAPDHLRKGASDKPKDTN